MATLKLNCTVSQIPYMVLPHNQCIDILSSGADNDADESHEIANDEEPSSPE
jgi:hypothetical protein